jgi:DtxR family Mn-dependent transcriptional regulator
MVKAMSKSAEDYLKLICQLSVGGEPVSVPALAAQLDISLASANEMVRKLMERGLLTYEPYRGVSLTEEGRSQATHVIRRHRLWERFLVDVLSVPWELVHEEACRLEHVTSPLLEERLAQALDNPEHCPHGYPVSGGDCEHCEEEVSLPLAQLEPGQRAVVEHVSERDPELLRYIGELGLRPQAVVEVEEVAPFGEPLTIRIGDAQEVIGQYVASQIAVRPIDQS